jgi:Holliday junction DNA helicase RuvA
MIVRIVGILEALEGNRAVVAPETPGGVPATLAYEVLVPTYLGQRLAGQVGERVTFQTIEYLESQGQGTSFIPRLLGFATADERAFFELFTTVKGLGNKRALRALAEEPALIAQAIASRDSRRLQALPEIGKRLAETVVAELFGKVDQFALPMTGGGPAEPRPRTRGMSAAAGEAVEALVSLGESRADAERMVFRTVDRDRDLQTTEQILQASLAAR